MTAREFVRELKRFCKDKVSCDQCVFHGFAYFAETCYPEHWNEANVSIVEQWAKEHPEKRKTYAEDFFEKFPKARKDKRGLPVPCRVIVYGGACHSGSAERADCAACWNEQMEGEE